MTITAKNKGRIDVWPSAANARDADTEESKVFGRMTIWPTTTEARSHLSSVGEGGGGGEGTTNYELREDGSIELREDGFNELREAA